MKQNNIKIENEIHGMQYTSIIFKWYLNFVNTYLPNIW